MLFYELNTFRKFLHKSDIGQSYAQLCSPTVPFTDWLYGDDLAKEIKDIADQNKLAYSLGHSYTSGYPSRGIYRGHGGPRGCGPSSAPRGRGYAYAPKNWRWGSGRGQKKNAAIPNTSLE